VRAAIRAKGEFRNRLSMQFLFGKESNIVASFNFQTEIEKFKGNFSVLGNLNTLKYDYQWWQL
jgi:hypothetical protein